MPDDRPRFFVPVPPGFFDLSPEEQEEIGLQMAREAQRQMGITPDA